MSAVARKTRVVRTGQFASFLFPTAADYNEYRLVFAGLKHQVKAKGPCKRTQQVATLLRVVGGFGPTGNVASVCIDLKV